MTPPSGNLTVCWAPLWSPGYENLGLEQVELRPHCADSAMLACTEDGRPFRLGYRLAWDREGRIREADLDVRIDGASRALRLRADGEGHWRQAQGAALPELDDCIDIDLWPTPLTNRLPLWRSALRIGERREFRMAWLPASALTWQAQHQTYTRLQDRLYRFESLDGSGFQAELPVDGHGLVLDYPDLFRRVGLRESGRPES